jgi:hypothetical protein
MAYPIGSPTCWNESNINCTVHDAQCGYGCVNNSAAEIKAMANWPHLRLFENTDRGSKVPLADSGSTGWKTPEEFGGGFSAACWFFGRDVYDKLETKRPIGLMATHVGGTPDQHWSSPDAIDKCKGSEPWDWPANFTDSVLWNGKVVPLLKTTIKGAIWWVAALDLTLTSQVSNSSHWLPGQVPRRGEFEGRWQAVQLFIPSND